MTKTEREYPNDLALVPLREMVVFPKLVVPLGVGREKSVAAITAAMSEERHLVVLAAQRDAEIDDVQPDQIHAIGTIAEIVRLLRIPDGSAQIIVQGLQRVKITGYTPETRFFKVAFEPIAEELGDAVEREAQLRNVKSLFDRYVDNGGAILPELAMTAKNTDDPAHFADLVASSPDLTLEQRQQLLEQRSVIERLKVLSVFLAKQNEILELKQKIQSEVQQTLDKTQREYILREQMKAIQKELGDDDQTSELKELREKIEQAGMPETVKEKALKEVGRLEKIPQASPETGVIRTYVDWLISLPWNKAANDDWDIQKAAKILDEVDKVGADFRGDPSSALLEVLDHEQNNTFSDHYLEVPYDLSKVIFITTANVEDTIIPPLRDRMEIIRLPGYTEDEKLHIAQQFLVPRQLREHGLTDENLAVPEDTLRLLIREYTHEAGVRNLDREIANIARKIPRRIAEGQTEKVIVQPGDVMGYLGPPRFEFGVAELEDQAGAVTGVAVNEYGGDVMTVEAILMQGRGEFALTGQIGKVMEESARAAVRYARSHALELGLKPGFFEDHFFHSHLPPVAIHKGGPSAGITMATAVVSVLTDRPVRREVAMTGEITLRGKVLPIGGLKEKLLAAHRAGIKVFILPEKNRKDLHEVPDEVKQSMELVMVKHVDEVLEKALLPAATRPSAPGLGFRRPLGESQPGTVN